MEKSIIFYKLMNESLKTTTANGIIWSFIERYSVQFVQFLITIVMARLLSPEAYGLVGMLAIFIAVSQIFIDGGFSSALIQSSSRTDEDYSTVFYINLFISILLYIFLFVASPFIAEFYHQPILSQITRIYSLNLILNSLVAVNKTKMVINVDFKTQSKVSFFAAIVSGILGIICAYKGCGVWALVVQVLSAALFNVLLSFYYVRWFPQFVFSLTSFRKLFKFGSKLLVAQIISAIYANIYTLVVGKKFSSISLGYYTRADQFGQFVGSNVSNILSRVSFPLLSKVQNDDEELLSVYDKYIQLSAFIMFPMVLGLCGVSKPLILILLTEKWICCASLLQILCLAYLFNGITTINLNILYAKGRSDLVLKLEVIKKMLAFTILIVSLFFDLWIICIGQVVYSLIAFYLNTIYTKRILDYGFLKQMRILFPYLLLAFVILLEALFSSRLIQNPYVSVCFSILLCTVTYVSGGFILKLYAYNSIKNYIIQYFKKNGYEKKN